MKAERELIEVGAASGEVQRLGPGHAERYRALMLEAYATHPESFTSTPAERAALPLAWWQQRLSERPDADSVVFGVLGQASTLGGAAGLAFSTASKTRHKASLFGMVLRPGWRGQGWGNALMQAILAEARCRPGLRLVQLTVTEGNQPALALYSRHGFVPFGLEPEAVEVEGRWLAKQHLWCRL